MPKMMNVSAVEILHHMKLTCQIPDVLEAIATRRIIAEAAKKAEITVDPKELQQAADSLRLAHKLVKADDTWAWLQKHYLSLDDFEEMAQANIISAKLANHLFAENVEKFYVQHQLNFLGAVTYEVILDDEDLALELFYALQENEITFSEIARQYITEPELRRTGGYQGIRYRKDFKAEIAAAVFAARTPQFLKPIVTQKGVHLILVEEFIQQQLTDQLRLQILGDLFSAWVKQQLSEIKVVAQMELDNQDLAKPA
ncbi:peptidylprolyl isomerase [Tolypothrix sp. PCC 7910]|uniref:peptidylprolyl isomerase n=1 Tax=Tolypothrix sp. PCC 7910 TaxID=2099387 RepID=UPI0014279B8B|nr:peptidylprolyl isomerase [Tolypothrix sp. PCC 7910]QIR39653.1 peptidylprolyl isomerase [Tolypothrix sp. PCC 7910]